MRTISKVLLGTVLVTQLAACGGRDPQNIPVVQAQDAGLDCNAIIAETTYNNQRITALTKEQGNTTGGNVALGVAGAILFWPMLFAMDFKGAAGKDMAAVQARQQYLATLAGQRACVLPPPPPPPAPVPAETVIKPNDR
jgi:hypothetical protein